MFSIQASIFEMDFRRKYLEPQTNFVEITRNAFEITRNSYKSCP